MTGLAPNMPASELIPDLGACTVSMVSDEHRIEARQRLAGPATRVGSILKLRRIFFLFFIAFLNSIFIN